MKLGALQLRSLKEDEGISPKKRFPLYFILDDVWDTYNIGGIFRLADALAAEKIYICGQSEIPPNHKIAKASVGTYKVVQWEYRESAVEAIRELRGEEGEDRGGRRSSQSEMLSRGEARGGDTDIQIVAIEQTAKAVPYTEFAYSFPLALVVGNETHGVSKEALKACNATVEIPLYGINKSLNVIVSAAIVGFHAYAQII